MRVDIDQDDWKSAGPEGPSSMSISSQSRVRNTSSR